MIDFNDAEPQRIIGDLIPDGTFCAVRMTLRPGDTDLPGYDNQQDRGIFKASTRSDAIYLDAEFTVLTGPHSKRKLWQTFTVHGGQLAEDGVSKAWNITKSTFRAIIDSALGLDPKDMSDAARAKRNLPSFSALDGLEFVARIGVRKGESAPGGGNYPDKNVIARVIEPNEPQWAEIRAGKEVAAAPVTLVARPTTAASAPAPAWQQGQSSAPAATSASEPQGPAWLRGEKK